MPGWQLSKEWWQFSQEYAQNKNTFEKVPIYDKSIFKMTNNISTQISTKQEFKKKDIDERTGVIAEYMINKWWC